MEIQRETKPLQNGLRIVLLPVIIGFVAVASVCAVTLAVKANSEVSSVIPASEMKWVNFQISPAGDDTNWFLWGGYDDGYSASFDDTWAYQIGFPKTESGCLDYDGSIWVYLSSDDFFYRKKFSTDDWYWWFTPTGSGSQASWAGLRIWVSSIEPSLCTLTQIPLVTKTRTRNPF